MFAKLAIVAGLILIAASIAVPLTKTNDVRRELRELIAKEGPMRKDLEARQAAFKPVEEKSEEKRQSIKDAPDQMDDEAFAKEADELFKKKDELEAAYFKQVSAEGALRGRLKYAKYVSEHEVPRYRRYGIYGAIAGALLTCLGLALWYSGSTPERRAPLSSAGTAAA